MKATERQASTLETTFQLVQRILELQIENGIIQFSGVEPTLSVTVPAAGTKKGSTAIAKLVTEMEQRAAAQGTTTECMTALTARHACKDKKCINFEKYCWVNKNDQVHYKLSSANFVGWNEAISANRGDTSIDRPPPYILESLYRLKKLERKEKKKDSAVTTNPFGGITDSSTHLAQAVYPGYPPVPPFTPYPFYPPAPFPSLPKASLFAILALKEKKQMDKEEREEQERRPRRSLPSHYHALTSSFRPETELRSSPVQEDLEEYIQWHIRRQP
ncbi:hypothetical protein MMC07_007524 [Pseudocyphellaria aurata]|nr:hypothetical protein [Pseudocyphellaria aurata]